MPRSASNIGVARRPESLVSDDRFGPVNRNQPQRPPRARPSDPPTPDIVGLVGVDLIDDLGPTLRYRAVQHSTGRPVEVVMANPTSPDGAAALDREAAVGGQLSGQSGIVPVFDLGTTATGERYLLRPYYENGSLGRLIGDRGPVPWPDAVVLLEQLSATVAEIHAYGIVHHGLEPGNIMLTDFLLPRVGALGSSSPLGSDLVVGPNPVPLGPYAAPELARGGEIRASADVYSLGAIGWSLLNGRDPEPGQGWTDPPPDTPVPPRLGRILRAAMSPEPADRPVDAAALVDLLRGPGRLEPGPVGDTAAPARPGPDTDPTLATAPMPAVVGTAATAPTGPAIPTDPTPAQVTGPDGRADPGETGPAPDHRRHLAPDARYVLLLVGLIFGTVVFMLTVAVLGIR
ncbi:MAG: protein kinase domain-containing protein [Acidimicrobiales bacterium]